MFAVAIALPPGKLRFSRKEVAELLGVKPNTIWRREHAGKVNVKPIRVVSTGDVYYTREMVQAHIEYHQREEGA